MLAVSTKPSGEHKLDVCQLCFKSNPKMRHLAQIKEHAQFKVVHAWLMREKSTLKETDLICLPCTKQIQRNHENPHFTPRWLSKPSSIPKKCNLENCQATVHAQTSLVAVDELEELEHILKERVNAFTVSTSTQSIGLCRMHYQKMYALLHQSTPCNSCAAIPKKGEVFSRHCPSPTLIHGYLSHISAETSSLTSSSTICLPCYKYFQSIIKSDKEPNPIVVTKDIDTILTSLSEHVHNFREKGEKMESSDFFEMIMCITAQNLAIKMKADEAMLLSIFYQLFVHTVYTESKHYPALHPIEHKNIPRKRWVLSRLYLHFGDVLTAACKHVCYGTLLFHKKCDLLKALSAALGKGRAYTTDSCSFSAAQKPQNKSQNTSIEAEKAKCSCPIENQTENVSKYLNEIVHKQAKTLITCFQNNPQLYTTFNIASYKEMVDPTLLQFIQQVTNSVRNRRRKLFESETGVNQVKQVRQLFLLSSLLYCTNTQCSMPLHALLTEAILCHGGTQELVHILNRVGAVASIDTNQRLATQVVQARIENGILPEIEERALSIVSIDNIDTLQPRAFVSCTDATRSWHGTSVQCVQPLPHTGLLEEHELNIQGGAHTRKHPASSPTASPAPAQRNKRRRRTLTELPSPHTGLSISHPKPSIMVCIVLHMTYMYLYLKLMTSD